MKNLVNLFKRYLHDTLGVTASVSKQKKLKTLSFFLQDNYDFFQIKLLHEDFIVLSLKNDETFTPATIRQHSQIVSEQLEKKVIFLSANITSFNRKRLIERKVPFVIPGNQMYLPDLGLDLREHFIKKKTKLTLFGPSTQTVILYTLIKKLTGPVTPSELSEKLGYSRMTMTRSIDEIEAAGLADVSIEGRERLVYFDQNRRELWEKALPLMKTPIKQSVWIKSLADKLTVCAAGLTALAQYSMLNSPILPVYAIAAGDWKQYKDSSFFELLPYSDEAECQLEVWHYSPYLLVNGTTVDQFSLYLSLRDVEDERVEAAVEKMMEDIKW